VTRKTKNTTVETLEWDSY